MNRKKINLLFLLIALLGMTSLKAQNLQLHFDSRHALYGDKAASSNYVTATFEMFKPDKWGSTFMFVDFDFNFDKGGIGLAYTEIARDFKIKNFPLMPHIEYNGGLGLVRGTGYSFSIPNAYLGGFSYPFTLGNFFMSTYLVYKLNDFKKTSHDVQWTLTWNANLASNKITLSGFADVWTENKDRVGGGESGKGVVFLSEPQFWYNVTPNLSFGTEVELSYNFVGGIAASRFYAVPTIAAKWNF